MLGCGEASGSSPEENSIWPSSAGARNLRAIRARRRRGRTLRQVGGRGTVAVGGSNPERRPTLILATARVEDVDRFLATFTTKGAEKRREYGSGARTSSVTRTTTPESGWCLSGIRRATTSCSRTPTCQRFSRRAVFGEGRSTQSWPGITRCRAFTGQDSGPVGTVPRAWKANDSGDDRPHRGADSNQRTRPSREATWSSATSSLAPRRRGSTSEGRTTTASSSATSPTARGTTASTSRAALRGSLRPELCAQRATSGSRFVAVRSTAAATRPAGTETGASATTSRVSESVPAPAPAGRSSLPQLHQLP